MDEPDENIEPFAPAEPPRVVRLNFAFRGDRIELLSRREFEKLLPPPPPGDEASGPPLFAAELRAADGTVLHRVPMRDPLTKHVEVFGEKAIVRAEVEEPSGAFTVVVPALEKGDRVALVSRRPPGHDPSAAALREPEVLVEVPLRDERTDRA